MSLPSTPPGTPGPGPGIQPPEPVPSGRVITVDFTQTGAPFEDEAPAPIPAGVIARHHNADLVWDAQRFWFSWSFTFDRTGGPPLFVVSASKTGVGLWGTVKQLAPDEAADVIKVMRIAHTVSVWMIHGQTPEYVLQFLDTALSEAEL